MVQCQVRLAAQEGLEVINKQQDDADYKRHGRIDIDSDGSAGDLSRGGASTRGRVVPTGMWLRTCDMASSPPGPERGEQIPALLSAA